MTFWALATEDQLSEAIGLRLLAELPVGRASVQLLRKQGFGYLRSRMGSWMQLARHQPVFLLTDLDRMECPVMLLKDWLGHHECPENLLFRVSVREIESWVLADHDAMRELIGKKGTLPPNPDELPDPKQSLLKLAKLARRDVRQDLVKIEGSVSSQGIGYNARPIQWVQNEWNPQRAADRSPSLQRTRLRLNALAGNIMAGS